MGLGRLMLVSGIARAVSPVLVALGNRARGQLEQPEVGKAYREVAGAFWRLITPR